MTSLPVFPHGRLEERFDDKHPLYAAAEALAEANRCLYCHDAPCIQACPTHIDIPSFIRKIATDNLLGSARTILTSNLLGYSCAKVCPVEVLCVGACVYNHEDVPPIAIGRLQRYATETVLASGKKVFTPKAKIGKKVALVGGGPASLACAGYLALEGVDAEIFEKRPASGGLNTTGIAPYKMPAEDSQREVEFIRSLGVVTHHGVEVRGDVAARLLADYDAVFLGPGLGPDRRMGVPGEDGPGVHGATAWIERMKLDPKTNLEGVRSAVVVGGGNTALDAVQELAKLGVPSVTLVYRRTEHDMSGYAHERAGALHDGVRFLFERVPVLVQRTDAGVTALVVGRNQNGAAARGTEQTLLADLVLVAIGQARLTELVASFPGVGLAGDRIAADPKTGRTGHPKVWAGGDAVNGGKEVVNAVEEGKLAAQDILRSFGRDVALVRRALTSAPYETTAPAPH